MLDALASQRVLVASTQLLVAPLSWLTSCNTKPGDGLTQLTTHHDPKKYPFLFITFWGMTTLLIGTLVVSGVHTALWLPRSFAYRRQIKNGPAEAGTYVRRFRRFHRNLHLLVVSSF